MPLRCTYQDEHDKHVNPVEIEKSRRTRGRKKKKKLPQAADGAMLVGAAHCSFIFIYVPTIVMACDYPLCIMQLI
jgi:hypothetical protein